MKADDKKKYETMTELPFEALFHLWRLQSQFSFDLSSS